jgi:hypothetical protein
MLYAQQFVGYGFPVEPAPLSRESLCAIVEVGDPPKTGKAGDSVSQDTGDAIAGLVIGVLLGVWAVLRLRSGKSYTSNPPARVTRREDPFSFWLSVGPLALIAAGLIAVSLAQLLKR